MTIHHDQLIVPSLITGFAEGNTFLITKFQIYLALLKSTPSFFFFFFCNSKLYLHLIHSEEKEAQSSPDGQLLQLLLTYPTFL